MHKYCPRCGTRLDVSITTCPECGARQPYNQTGLLAGGVTRALSGRRERLAAMAICFFLGGFGGHKFYSGETRSGWIRLMLFWVYVPFFLSIKDFFELWHMTDEEFNAKYNP